MSSENVKLFTRSDVAKHNSKENNWFVIHNGVYDVTAFLNEVSTVVGRFFSLFFFFFVEK